MVILAGPKESLDWLQLLQKDSGQLTQQDAIQRIWKGIAGRLPRNPEPVNRED